MQRSSCVHEPVWVAVHATLMICYCITVILLLYPDTVDALAHYTTESVTRYTLHYTQCPECYTRVSRYTTKRVLPIG